MPSDTLMRTRSQEEGCRRHWQTGPQGNRRTTGEPCTVRRLAMPQRALARMNDDVAQTPHGHRATLNNSRRRQAREAAATATREVDVGGSAV